MKTREIDGYWDENTFAVKGNKSEWDFLPTKVKPGLVVPYPVSGTAGLWGLENPPGLFATLDIATKKVASSVPVPPYLKTTLSFLKVYDWVPSVSSDLIALKISSCAYVLSSVEQDSMHYDQTWYCVDLFLTKQDVYAYSTPLYQLLEWRIHAAFLTIEAEFKKVEQATKKQFPEFADKWCVQWKPSGLPKVIIPSKPQ